MRAAHWSETLIRLLVPALQPAMAFSGPVRPAPRRRRAPPPPTEHEPMTEEEALQIQLALVCLACF